MSGAERLRRLEAVCLRDMAELAGLDGYAGGRLALRVALGRRVRRFGRDIAGFDAAVGRLGVVSAARGLVHRYGSEVRAVGAGRVPVAGPVLLVANHPGLADALAVYATAPRGDLVTLARAQPLLRFLPEMGRHLLVVPDSGPDRARAARAMLRHLRDGGAVLLFPAGHLEPEPTLVAEGAGLLGEWSPGVGTLVRLAAGHGIPLQVVPTAISGVLARTTWRRFGPLIRRRRTPQGRADLAALLQLVFPRLGATTIRVRYGEPLDAAALAAAGPDAAGIAERVRAALDEGLRAED
jgi:1-acyl-sn-glycerol-3-phosphate acyltransferase